MLEMLKSLFGLSDNSISREDLLNGTIVDVRTPGEFQQGHAKGSINIPLQQLEGSLLKIRQLKEPIITCCRSGNRSGMATRQLNGQGIKAINGGTWQQVRDQLEA